MHNFILDLKKHRIPPKSENTIKKNILKASKTLTDINPQNVYKKINAEMSFHRFMRFSHYF